MSHIKKRLMAVVPLSLALCLLVLSPTPARAQGSDDEAQIRSLVERFFASYQREDLNALMSLWSEKSGALAAGKQSLQQTFGELRNIEVKQLEVSKVTLEGDRAKVQLFVELSGVNEKTGKPLDPGKVARTMRVVREASGWKVWQYVSAAEDFAADLLAAGTEESRAALLTANPERVNAALVRELNKQGRNLFSQSKFPQALSVYDVALTIAARINDKAGAALVLIGVGNAYYRQGDYTKSADAFGQSLKLSEETGNKIDMARAISSLALVQRARGNYKEALELNLKGLRWREEAGDKVGIAVSLGNIAGVYYALGSYDQALEYQLRGIKIEEELGDKEGIAISLSNIGGIYLIQGDYLRALEMRQKSLKIREELGDKASTAQALSSMGLVYFAHGDYAQALEFYDKSLKLADEIGAKGLTSGLYLNIGNVYYEQGDYPKAVEFMLKSMKLNEESGNKANIAALLNNLGSVYNDQGEYERALDALQRSLKMAEELEYEQVIVSSLINIAQTQHYLGKYQTALDYTGRGIALARRNDEADILWQALTTEGKARAALNQFEGARQSFLGAIEVIEKLRTSLAVGERGRQLFFEGKVAPYYAMIDLLLKQKETMQALSYAEHAKGRVLLDVLSNGRVNIDKAMTQEELERDRALTAEINGLNTRISRLRAGGDQASLQALRGQLEKARLEYESFQSGLYAAHPELKVKRGQTHPLTLGEAEALLADRHSALLEYVVGENDSYLFVLTKSAGQAVTLKVYPLGLKGRQLSEMTKDFLRRVAEHDLTIKSPAQRLYNLLVKPAESQLRGVSRLIIVPDGPLWDLPFQALHRGPRGYLLEDYAVSYAPSLSVLREMKRKGAELLKARGVEPRPAAARVNGSPSFRTELLALGNPLLSGETATKINALREEDSLSPLPDAEREVNTLGKLYGPARSKVLVGGRATEEEVKAEAGKYLLLHFATHALLDDRNPMYSRIMLSPAGQGVREDGLLEAWELMRLDLTAELAVLSACQTARGRIGAGEGIIGMSWALFVAGCPAVVVSQWKVDSARTTDLMVEFHKNLLRLKARGARMTKAEALRAAALKLLHGQYSHPAYWAGFVLVGNEE